MSKKQSILSFPSRGKWGDWKYRGNCSGYIQKFLLEHYGLDQDSSKAYVECFAGSGTGEDVCRDLGITNARFLDLNPKYGGFNLLTDEIPSADFVFSHPPYASIIKYSGPGNMWGDKPHPDDISHCSYEEFIKKLDYINAKIYAALRNGGRHAILVGDVRKDGKFYSIIKDMAYIGDLEEHIIKAQHHVWSDNVQYSNEDRLIRIAHEHLLVFKKNSVWTIPLTIIKKGFKDFRKVNVGTWKDLVRAALEDLGGIATLNQLYKMLEHTSKAKGNPHWQEKIRQTLQTYTEFKNIQRGLWGLNKEPIYQAV